MAQWIQLSDGVWQYSMVSNETRPTTFGHYSTNAIPFGAMLVETDTGKRSRWLSSQGSYQWCNDVTELATSAGGELLGSYPNPTVKGLHAGSTHHAELHKANHESGGSDALMDGVAPSTQAFGDAPAAGVALVAAKRDHMHAMPANPVPGHEAAADPHTGYQRESEKDAVSGYAGLDANARVNYARIQNVSTTARVLGRNSVGAGVLEEITPTQLTALLDLFTSALKGLVPASGGGTANFLRADGTFAAPPGGGGGVNTLKTTADQTINGTAFQNITGMTFAVSANIDYAFKFYIVFRSAFTTTGFRFAVNGPAGAVVDYFTTYQTVANSETAGVATWLQKHSVTFDAMTVLTSTITAGVDLVCMIEGRIKVGSTAGTLAARVASELANNDLVIQKGSWGMWF